jgi:pSer/pThr/pTyr-binding forkhead associated (FHA) protein
MEAKIMKRPPVIVVQLIHIQGPLKGEIQEFTEAQISIGRQTSCLLRFPPDLTIISRQHADIVREGNQFKLIDHSANGTFVNGKQIQEALLKDGDVLEFAKGGPKASFLTQIKEESYVPPPPKEAAAAKEPPPPPRKEPPAPRPEPPRAAPERPTFPDAAMPPPRSEPAEEKLIVQSVRAPLVIQFGPTLRSFKQLPVTIGKNPKSDFKLDRPFILDQHAQIFFAQNQYWVKDLTGQRLVQINGQPVGPQAPLRGNDELSLTPRGPVFRFLGEGRLAEVSAPSSEEPPEPPAKKREAPQRPAPEPKASDGLFSKVKKLFES